MVVIWLLALAGCAGTACDDRCHADQARARLATDMDAAITEVEAVADPVVRTAVIMEALRRPDLHPTPPQATRLCEAAPNDATRVHCQNSFLRPHLQGPAAHGG